MSRCNLCGGNISDRNDSRFCVYCNSTFHKGCITKHFYSEKSCPVCRVKMSLMFMRRGFPPAVKEEPSPVETRKPELPSQPPLERMTAQREIRELERRPEERPRVPTPRGYTPARPGSTERLDRTKKLPYRKGYTGGKSIKDMLSEAVAILKGNPIIVIPYLIPFILLYVGILVGYGQFISVQDQPNLMDESEPSPLGEWVSVYTKEFESNSIDESQSKYDPSFSYRFFSTYPELTSIIGVLYMIFSVISVSTAVGMTYFSIEGKMITLSGIWKEIGIKRLVMLLVANLLVAILIRIPRMLLFSVFSISILVLIFITELVLGMFFVFINQGIIIDYLGVGATIYNSCIVVKRNFLSILILMLFFTFITDVVDVSIIRNILEISVTLYSPVAFTLLYYDRT